MSNELIEAGALRQFRHNNDVSLEGDFVFAYDLDITNREFARLKAAQENVMPPFAEPASQHSAWVSVDDERKPEPGVTVLLYVRTLKYGLDVDLCYFRTEDAQIEMGEYRMRDGFDHGYFDCYASTISDNDWVTHWMPMPQPPQEVLEQPQV